MLAQAGVNTALAVPIAVAVLPEKEGIGMANFANNPAMTRFLDGQANAMRAAEDAIRRCHRKGI